MRWPWTRWATELPPQTATAARPASDAPAPPSPMGWAFLPPIQRTLTPGIAPVTRPAEFPTELSAWRSPAFTGSLSHAVVDTTPGGLIDGDGHGLGQPTNTSVPSPELTLLPPPRPTAVQRSIRTGAAAPRPATATGSVDVPEFPSLTEAPSVGMLLVHRAVIDDPKPDATPDPSPDPTPDSTPDPVPGPVPGPGPEPVDQPQSADPALIESANTPPAGAGSPTTSADSSTSVDQARPPLGRAAVSSPEPLAPAGVPGTVQRNVHTPLARPATSSPSATPVAETRHHLGLGPPLASVPETAVPVPPPELDRRNPPQPEARPDNVGFTEIPIQRTVSPPVAAAVPPTTSPGMPETPPQPHLTLPPARGATEPTSTQPTSTQPNEPDAQRQVADKGAPEPPVDVDAGPVATTAPSPVVADPVASEAITPPAATLTSVPLPLGDGLQTSIQRSSTHPGTGTPTPTLVVRPAPLVPGRRSRERTVPIQRMPAAEPPAPGGDPPAVSRLLQRASSSADPPLSTRWPDEVPVARELDTFPPEPFDGADEDPSLLPSGVAAPLSSGSTTGSSAAHPVHVARAVSHPAAPAVAPEIGLSTTPRAAPGVLPVARSAAEPMPVQAPAVAAPEPGAVDVSERSAPWVDASSALDAGQVVVARAEDPVTADPAPAPAAGSAAGVATPGAAGGAEDVDALAQRLFPPMLRRLKNELLLDRERRGVRTDAW